MAEDEIRFPVMHPPGANGRGPILSTTDLAALRAKSGPRYRAYIAAHSLIWHPGVTRRRHPKGRGWGWSRDLADCPVLAAEDRDRLAYATAGERWKRSRAAKDAVWEKLPGIRILDRAADTPDGRRGWRIAPDKHGPPDLIAAATNDRDVRHYLGARRHYLGEATRREAYSHAIPVRPDPDSDIRSGVGGNGIGDRRRATPPRPPSSP